MPNGCWIVLKINIEVTKAAGFVSPFPCKLKQSHYPDLLCSYPGECSKKHA